ncbi:MAG: LptA/OstA family protein [Terrimicrobiaceae bacterium]
MTKIHSLIGLLVLGVCTAQAQQSPSMNQGEKQEPAPLTGFAGLGKDRPADAKTEITANKEATFDNAASVAEFTGRVVVRDPQFTLTCDHLKVSLSKSRKGMETAEAIGNVVIVQENTEKSGQTTKAIGRAGQATYVPGTGEVTLKSWPSVQQGMNNQVSTEEGTIMILNRNGKSRTVGPSKTVISETSEAGAAK